MRPYIAELLPIIITLLQDTVYSGKWEVSLSAWSTRDHFLCVLLKYMPSVMDAIAQHGSSYLNADYVISCIVKFVNICQK